VLSEICGVERETGINGNVLSLGKPSYRVNPPIVRDLNNWQSAAYLILDERLPIETPFRRVSAHQRIRLEFMRRNDGINKHGVVASQRRFSYGLE